MDSQQQIPTEAELAHIAHNLMAVKMYSLATFVMLFYDIIITFGEEVEYIWKRKFTPFSVLWFLNRYLSPLGFIIIILSFHDSRWTANESLCDKIVLFPAILGTLTTTTIGLIFIVRLYATYSANKVILVLMISLLVLEQAVKIWSFTGGQRLRLPPGLVGCILTAGPDETRFTFTWIAELIFDSIVLALTLYRVTSLNQLSGGGVQSLLSLILRDGIIYFAVILVANLVTVLTFLLAPADLKALNASFSISITPLMVSRLVLNLRSADTTHVSGAHTNGRWTRVSGTEMELGESMHFARRVSDSTTHK